MCTYVAGTDTGSSDHFLVWMELGRPSKTSSKKRKHVIMELGRPSKTSKKRKHIIRKTTVNRFGEDEVKLSYQNAKG